MTSLASVIFDPSGNLEIILERSTKADQAKAFMKDLARNDPELHKDLERQARLALVGVRNRIKPSDKVEALKVLFQWNPELDPTESGDTYGVRAFITALSKNAKEAGKAKRLYDRAVDVFFKELYGSAAEQQHSDSDNDAGDQPPVED